MLRVWGVYQEGDEGGEGTGKLPLPMLSILRFSCLGSSLLSVDQQIITPGYAVERKLQARDSLKRMPLSDIPEKILPGHGAGKL